MNNFNKVWWSGSTVVDQQIKDTFTETLKLAEAGHLDDWNEEPKGMLALIIVFDQFSRHIYRGKKEAFLNDSKALEISLKLQKLPEFIYFAKDEKFFTLMPCEHSEDLSTIKLALKGFEEAGFSTKDCQNHFDIIKQFGRYPHRNKILGRKSTKEEEDWINWNNKTKTYNFAIIPP